MKIEQLNCVAMGCGPGGFTGVRVAASASQGLAYATESPVCRISSLAALAHTAARERGVHLIIGAEMTVAEVGRGPASGA